MTEQPVAALNIFVDGTWLLVQCAAGQSLANATEHPDQRFPLDFAKLNAELIRHVAAIGGACDRTGETCIATSIFALPDDFDDWPNRFEDITADHIERTKRAVFAREAFVADAVKAAYSTEAVFRPKIRDYILRRLEEKRYQEKQVDTSVVALLVRSAITRPGDYHALITGDADILPAVKVAYPQFTQNVFVATTHPDELRSEEHTSELQSQSNLVCRLLLEKKTKSEEDPSELHLQYNLVGRLLLENNNT